MLRSMACLLVATALAGCGMDSDPPRAAPPPTRSATPPLTTTPGSAPAIDPARGRAAAAELDAARELVREGRYTEALPRFERLVAAEPGNPRIHCETGFVALRAESLDVAEREFTTGLAIFERAGSITPDRRVPYAMCSFNAGVLAERRNQPAVAIDRFERSLAQRPNATVARHLASARASAVAAGSPLPATPPVNVRAIRRRFAGPGGRVATLVHEDVPHDDSDVEQGCFDESVVLFDPRVGEHRMPIVGACPETFSVFRDWAHVHDPAWVDAGGDWGAVFTVLADHGGIGDSEPDRGLVDGSTTSLFVFAVRDGAWIAASIPVRRIERADCDNDPCDDPDSSEDDDAQLRARFEDEFDVEARFADGTITLSIRRRVGSLELPELGVHPLAWLFENYGS